MAVGKLSSLGLGSNVLNYDVIDKLKKADEQSLIKPIDRKMEKNIEKQKELIDIKDSLSQISAQTRMLSDYSTYIARNVNVVGDSVEATAAPGVPVQDINIEVKKLAKNDINEVGTKFTSRDDAFSKEDSILDFYNNGNRYRVNIKAGMSLGDVAQKITDASSGNVIGVVMKTGGSKPYQLMINSKDQGEGNRVYFGAVMESDRLNEKPLTLAGEDDFYVEFFDKYENLQRVSINLGLSKPSNLQQKAEDIKEALQKEISNNQDLQDLVENGDISINLAQEGKTLLFNDRRGLKIKVGGAKANELGFNVNNSESKTTDLFESELRIKSGRLDGVITIGSVPIDLSVLTKDNNTSTQNAEAIVGALENIAGVHAKNVQGKIFLNSEIGALSVGASDAEGLKSLQALGLKPGIMHDYSHMQKNLFQFKNVQKGSDAELTFNGALIKRATNQINDIIGGLNINILNTTPEGKADKISITHDTKQIVEGVKEFVKLYNEAVPKLEASTRYDPTTKKGGVFNMESTIRMIRPDINQAFLYSIGNGLDVTSLVSYGLSLNDKSIMSIDESKLSSQISSDPQKAVDFFYGKNGKDRFGREQKIDGVFPKINKVLDDLLSGGNARLKVFEETLNKEISDLESEKKSNNKLLESRYDTMASRFAAYDEQISKANNSFNSVQMMIDQAANSKKK